MPDRPHHPQRKPWPKYPSSNVEFAVLHEDLGRIHDLLFLILEFQMATKSDVTAALADLTTAINAAVDKLLHPPTQPPVEDTAFLGTIVDGLTGLTASINAALNQTPTPPATTLDLVAATPAPNATDVNPSAPITVEFNTPVEQIGKLVIEVTNVNSQAVVTSQTSTGNIATVRPSSPLEAGASYNVSVTADGMLPASWSFVTAA